MKDENQKTIFLVEDEAVISAATEKTLRKFGYNVITAATGEKAVETALNHSKINLILMDAYLGKGINGPEAAQQILAKRHLPIVFLTSHTEKEMLEKIRGITRYGYVIKNSGDFVLQSSIEMAFDLFESNENLRIQHELGFQLNTTTDLQSALDVVLKSLLQLESIDSGGIYLVDPATGALDIAVHHGLSPEFISQVTHFSPDSKSVTMVKPGKAIYGNYNDVRPITDDIRIKEGLRSIAIIPIMSNEKVIAILNLASHTHESVPTSTRITLETLAMQIGNILLRLRTEKKLRENEELYRTLFENTGSAMLLIEEDMTMSMVNNEFINRSGYTRDEIISKMKWTDLVHPDDLGRMIEQHKLRRKNHDSALPGYEFRFRTKSGEIRDTILTIELIPGTKKSIASLIDITERKRAEEAFQANRSQLIDIIEFLPDATLAIDNEKRVIIWNKAIEKMTGVPASEMIGKSNYAYTLPFYGESRLLLLDLFFNKQHKNLDLYSNITKEDETLNVEVFCSGLNNNKGAWVVAKASPLHDHFGNIIGAIESITDITERKYAEESLKESEEKLREIIEQSFDGIMISDEIGNIIIWNRIIAEITGLQPERVIGKPAWEVICKIIPENMKTPDILENQKAIMKNILEMKIDFPGRTLDQEIVTPDGKHKIVQDTSFLIKGEKSVRFGTILRDITEKKHAEDELIVKENRFRSVVEKSLVGITIINGNYQFTYVNSKFCEIMGYPESELIGMDFNNTLAEESREIASNRYKKRQQGESVPEQYEITIIRKNGEKRICEVRNAVYMDSFGIINSITQIIDITERKQAEIEKDSLKEQLLQTQKLESLGRLAGGVAHDFNNLLTGILGFSELASFKLPQGHPALDDISMIINAGNKAADLVKQLLAFGRKNKLEFSMIDLNESVKNTAKMLSRLIGDNITMENKISSNMKRISADSTQVSQIMINLVINARDAMPDGGVITIETSMESLDEKYVKNFENLSPGEYAVFSVSDTGIGMTKEVQKEIFDPFFTTKEKGKGTGLGLSTVFGIVKQHKGNILVYSELGKGSTFKVYLPCLENEELKHDAEIEIKDLHGSESILIVDDNPTPQKVAGETLKSQGYTIYNASSGEEALELFENKDFNVDLVISDIVMPGIDGNDLADRLSKLRPGIKIVLMSGYSNMAGETDKKTGYDFIQKPFTPNFIMNYVRKVLNKKKE